MKRIEIAREWIDKADEDFGFASLSLEQTSYFSQVCFHFQQAAEKYLKALIVAHDLELRRIHNLMELFVISKKAVPEVDSLKESCAYLNPYYIDTRYPVHWPGHYDRNVALEAKKHAKKIADFVKRALGI